MQTVALILFLSMLVLALGAALGHRRERRYLMEPPTPRPTKDADEIVLDALRGSRAGDVRPPAPAIPRCAVMARGRQCRRYKGHSGAHQYSVALVSR